MRRFFAHEKSHRVRAQPERGAMSRFELPKVESRVPSLGSRAAPKKRW
jgi:hypothetical protein